MDKIYIIMCQRGLSKAVIPFCFKKHPDALIYKQALKKTNHNIAEYVIMDLDLLDMDAVIKSTVEKQLKQFRMGKLIPS